MYTRVLVTFFFYNIGTSGRFDSRQPVDVRHALLDRA